MRSTALVLATLAALAGCGSSSGPTKAQYIARADPICASARAQAQPIIAQLAGAAGSLNASSARALAPAVSRLHAIGVSYLSRLRALRQPSGDHAAIDGFLRPSAQVVDAVGTAATALAGGDSVRALAQLQQIQPPALDANSAAERYGLRQCGSVLSVG
jgi:hypothetical protein